MHIELRVVLSPQDTNDLHAFQLKRDLAYRDVLAQLRHLEPFRRDQEIIFGRLEPSELEEVERVCRNTGLIPTFTPRMLYSTEEIRSAVYVPLLVAGQWIDRDQDGEPLNSYSTCVCTVCKSYDLFEVPNPFVVRRPRRTDVLAIWQASNGVRVLSRTLWRELSAEFQSDVQMGDVKYADGGRAEELMWLMPKPTIGAYVDRKVLRKCNRCCRPLEIRGQYFRDPLLRSLFIVENMGQTNYQVALVGNWFGVMGTSHPGVSWDITVSGVFHERLQTMHVPGHVNAERVVHGADDLPRWLAARLRATS